MATGTVQTIITQIQNDMSTVWLATNAPTGASTLYTNLAGTTATNLGVSIQDIETDIGSLKTSVDTNTTNIATNTTDIATNTSDIATNTNLLANTTYTTVTDQTGNTPAGPAAGTAVTGYANVIQAIDNDMTNIDALAGTTVTYTSPITGT